MVNIRKSFSYLLIAVMIEGCYNKRAEIATAILYNNVDLLTVESNRAFTGAMLGKFPVGSDVILLENFVFSLGGKCDTSGIID